MNVIEKKLNQIILENRDDIKVIIARYLLDNIKNLGYHSAKSLAAACNVSTASIIRFCQTIGYSGLNELKFAQKTLMNDNSLLFYQSTISESEIQASIYQEYLHLKKKSSLHVLGIFEKEDPKFMKHINFKNNVYIFCFNVAYFATQNFVQRMRGLRYHFYLESDLSTIDWYISKLEDDDIAIFVSLSGDNYVLMNYARKISIAQKIGLFGSPSHMNEFFNEFYVLTPGIKPIWDIFTIQSQALQQFWDFIYFYFWKISKNKK